MGVITFGPSVFVYLKGIFLASGRKSEKDELLGTCHWWWWWGSCDPQTDP